MPISDIVSHAFEKLGHEKELLEFRDILHLTLGLVMDFINAKGDSLRLSKGQNFSPLCRFLRSIPKGAELCHQCDLCHAQQASLGKAPLIYTCHAGLTDLVVPIFDHHGEYLGSITSGQCRVLPEKASFPPHQTLAALAQELKIPLSRLTTLYKKSPILHPKQLKGLIRYLQVVGRLLVSTHHNLVFMEALDAPERITEAKKYIHKHFTERISLDRIARHFSVAPQYFCREFHQKCGVSFNAYLNYYRIEKAKEFLQDSRIYATNVADLTGFGSLCQFNRVFKKQTGLTPGEWRKRNAGK